MIEKINKNILPLFSKQKSDFGGRDNFSLLYYLQLNGTVDLAVALIEILWPSVIIVNGCYVREKESSTYNIPENNTMTNIQRQDFEKLSNHLHIYDVFPNTHNDTPLVAYEYIAQRTLEMWSAALQYQYPNVSFCFHYETEPDAYGPTITFWHSRNEDIPK